MNNEKIIYFDLLSYDKKNYSDLLSLVQQLLIIFQLSAKNFDKFPAAI